jgi:hypothetical protein
VFNPLVSLILFVDGSLGDSDFNNFGESGGVDEVLFGVESDFGWTFLIEFLLSRIGNLLQVG